MSAIPQGNASWGTPLYTPPSKGVYIGNVIPGGVSTINQTGVLGATAVDGSLTINTLPAPGTYLSSLSSQPQSVLRLTGANGTSFIQGSNIAFAMPYSGNAGVRILPSTNQVNVNNIVYVSTIYPIGVGGTGVAGGINMTELTSSIKGYGWATVSPSLYP